ncbi:MAG: tetratricopeptide repeat protein [Maribacter sp.]
MENGKKILVYNLLIILSVFGCKDTKKEVIENTAVQKFITPLGKEFSIPEPTEELILKYEEAKIDFENNPNNVENIIWFGRRAAYLGQYEKAIAIYTDGITKFPKVSRLYRHRGHRYISIRKYELAIKDLDKASTLIEGQENEMEADGMPNAMNIPVSSKHGNIWYHLGLAYYLNHDYENAYHAYLKCRASGNNDDNIVSSTHWLYMIQRRLGNEELAIEMLEPITDKANIIENKSYYNLCKFYKGLIPMDSLINTKKGNPSSDAVLYGLANWHFYNNDKKKADKLMQEMMDSKAWSSFGYLAAESDLIKYFKGKNSTF